MFLILLICAVWDVHFHPIYSNNLFTCSQDGSLWHWDASLNTPSSATMMPSSSQPPLHPSSSSFPSATSNSYSSSNVLLSRGAGFLQAPLLSGGLTNQATLQQHTTTNRISLAEPQSSTAAGRSLEETAAHSGAGFGGGGGGTSPWLSGAIQQGKVEIVNLIPDHRISVNSLDIESRHLICGTDGEALFVVPNLTLT